MPVTVRGAAHALRFDSSSAWLACDCGCRWAPTPGMSRGWQPRSARRVRADPSAERADLSRRSARWTCGAGTMGWRPSFGVNGRWTCTAGICSCSSGGGMPRWTPKTGQ